MLGPRSGTGNTIRSTEVYDVGCSGMTVASGDRTTLTPGSAVVEGNTLHDFSLWKRMSAHNLATHPPTQPVTACTHLAPCPANRGLWPRPLREQRGRPRTPG